MLFIAAASGGVRGSLRRMKIENPERYAQLQHRWEMNQIIAEMERKMTQQHRKEVAVKALKAVKNFFEGGKRLFKKL